MFGVEQFEKHVRVDGHSTEHPHQLLSSLLFVEQLTLTRDVATIALSCHVLPHGLEVLPSENFAAYFRLNCDFKQLLGQDVPELSSVALTKGYQSLLVNQESQGVHRVPIQMKDDFLNVRVLVAILLVIQTGIALGQRFELVKEIRDQF